ncbi:hypothetical protein [Streptomyces sp. NPDC057854]|uniref:hypothetical protein n=1 Tax=unclassified Streptomyces TaxID=2593676 RepID=UPI0036B19F03
MPDIAAAATALTRVAEAAQQGPGGTLRVVLLVSMVGGALLAWFLLRGYRSGESTDDTPAAPPAPARDRSADTAARGAAGDAGDANA